MHKSHANSRSKGGKEDMHTEQRLLSALPGPQHPWWTTPPGLGTATEALGEALYLQTDPVEHWLCNNSGLQGNTVSHAWWFFDCLHPKRTRHAARLQVHAITLWNCFLERTAILHYCQTGFTSASLTGLMTLCDIWILSCVQVKNVKAVIQVKAW